MKPETFSRRTTGYGLRPVSSTFITRKWELRKLYYAENILFETTGSYSDSLTVLQETLAAYAPNDFNKTVKALDYTIETTSHSYLITCPSADGAHLLLLSSNGKVEKVTR